MATQNTQIVSTTQTSRREVLKKAAYVAPLILTLPAIPTFADKGSKAPKEKKQK